MHLLPDIAEVRSFNLLISCVPALKGRRITNTSMKNILIALAVITASIFIPAAASAQTAADSVKTAVLKVRNLHCNGDMPTIKTRLLNQEGIDEVSFTDRSGETSVFTITYHSSVTDESAIRKAVESTPGCDDKGETPYRVVQETRKKKKG